MKRSSHSFSITNLDVFTGCFVCPRCGACDDTNLFSSCYLRWLNVRNEGIKASSGLVDHLAENVVKNDWSAWNFRKWSSRLNMGLRIRGTQIISQIFDLVRWGWSLWAHLHTILMSWFSEKRIWSRHPMQQIQ